MHKSIPHDDQFQLLFIKVFYPVVVGYVSSDEILLFFIPLGAVETVHKDEEDHWEWDGRSKKSEAAVRQQSRERWAEVCNLIMLASE